MKMGRFLFTILSISISISAIIIIFSITHSFKKEMQGDFINYGADILQIWSDYSDKEEKDYYFTLSDVYSIKRKFKEIRNVGIMVSGIEKTHYDGGCVAQGVVRITDEKYLPVFEGWSGPFSGSLWGTLPGNKDVLKLKIKKGRFINETDLKLKRRVCVLGNYIYNQVGGEKIIGKKLELREYFAENKYDQYVFTVIGGLQRVVPFGIPYLDMINFEGRGYMENETNLAVLIPITTLQDEIKKERGKVEKDGLGFGWIFLQTQLYGEDKQMGKREKSKDENPTCISEKIKSLMNKIIGFCKEIHGKDKEIDLSYRGKLMIELERQINQANRFIGIIGGVSLISSMVSILSMMLFSVSTRTSEIGIRRAFGARKRDIFRQFLMEALMITGKGGLVGIVLGLCGAYLLGKYTGWEMVIPWCSLVLSIGTICIIAIISGIYPALKAAKIPPAQAVKYE